MQDSSQLRRRATAAAVAVAAVGLTIVLLKSGSGQPVAAPAPQGPNAASNTPTSEAAVDLSPSQLQAIKIGPVGTYRFPVERAAIGSIDYDEDLSVQVFSPYSGKIITALANLGDDVLKGQPLYTIASPDLLQAESNLTGAAATLALTSKEPRAFTEPTAFPNESSSRRPPINRRRKALSRPHETPSAYSARPKPK